jgi:hypothetical protein
MPGPFGLDPAPGGFIPGLLGGAVGIGPVFLLIKFGFLFLERKQN